MPMNVKQRPPFIQIADENIEPLSKVIAFHPELARRMGSIEAAILFQQLYYWSSKGARNDGFVYKTKEEIEEETTLTRKQQDRVKNLLVEGGWLEVKLIKANGSPTLHYKVLADIAFAFIPKGTNGLVQKGLMEKYKRDETYIRKTENTTENTTDTKYARSSNEDVPMDLKQFISWTKGSKQRHIQIIGEYAEAKSPDYKTKAQWNAFMKRNLRAAKELAPFSEEQMSAAAQEVYGANWIRKWTLETIAKFLIK